MTTVTPPATPTPNAGNTGPEPTYDAQFVADHIGISRETVYKLVQSGELRALRVGRLVRITASALDEFLAGDTY